MRVFILIIAFWISSLANELQLEHNFDKALQKAKNQNKEVMMMYTAVWCPECNYMKDVVFKDKEVVRYIQEHFIVLTLDIQKDTLPEGHSYMGIPTFFFIGKDAKEKNKIVGGDKASKFLETLKALK